VLLSYSPEWAFVPTGAIAWLIFRSRIKTLVRFMNTVYLDKKERVLKWLTPQRRIVLGAVASVLLFAPIFTEHVESRFVLEPSQKAIIRTPLDATVKQVLVAEGQIVRAGEVIVRMQDVEVERAADLARAERDQAQAHAVEAQLRYASFGEADARRIAARQVSEAAQKKLAALAVRSPISGKVVSARPQDLSGARLEAGTVLVEVSDDAMFRARLYVAEFDVRKILLGQRVALLMDSAVVPRHGEISAIKPAATDIAEGLIRKQDYKGLQPPNYYVAEVLLPNVGTLREGMSGTAKVVIGRRSLATILWTAGREFAGRKIW
jgi:multidrug efflux pump subunit AcrA (membrane-fusion protein)